MVDACVIHPPNDPDCRFAYYRSDAFLTQDDLEPADILMSRSEIQWRPGDPLPPGRPPIGDFVCHLGKADYSHGTVWDGDEIIEAIGHPGKDGQQGLVVKRNLVWILCEQEYVDVYRVRADYRIDHDWPPDWRDAVVARARRAVGGAYAWNQLILAAGLVAIEGLLDNEQLKNFLDVNGKLMVGEINRAVTEFRAMGGQEQKSMVCTELVCTSFHEAKPGGLLGLPVDLGRVYGHGGAETHTPDPEGDPGDIMDDLRAGHEQIGAALEGVAQMDSIDELFREGNFDRYVPVMTSLCRGLLQAARMPIPRKPAGRGAYKAGGPEIPLTSIPPKYVQLSPALEYVGTLPSLPPRTINGPRPESTQEVAASGASR